ncbi:MAG: PH domain-containing protein [Rhodothermales bacterium]|nr:PH domain-containing protein [Rhodothermales bacterium]
MTTDPADMRDTQMLHPMTLVQRFLVSLPAFVILLLPVIRSGGSAEIVPILAVVLYSVLALPLIFLRYFRFRYQITEREVLIHSGVLTRQHRSIPLERIQNIEIEQSLLPRLFGTAKVKIETAGSAQTEGVLEYVSLATARDIREIVRTYQLQQSERLDTSAASGTAADPATDTQPGAASRADTQAEATREVLLDLPLYRVLLVGMLRFSLLYIALIFSALQQLNPDPDEIELWLTRGFLQPIAEFATASPWLLTTIAIGIAILLSWVTGILVSFNKYYNFMLWLEGNKLHKRSGLLTLSEGTIPLKRVQALLFRANALMRHFRWYALQLQTMGLESAQKGEQLAAPLARLSEAQAIGRRIYPFEMPAAFHPVSRLTIRRAIVRYTVLLALAMAALAYWAGVAVAWLLLLLPLIVVYAIMRYRNMGYAFDDTTLFVRKGVFIYTVWVIPIARFQVLYTSSSFFQRRLGLQTVYADTAGAGNVTSAEIFDLPADEAGRVVDALYARFKAPFTSASDDHPLVGEVSPRS